jgi:transposase-like protein
VRDRGSVEAGRSSGVDGSLVEVQRVGVACVKKSVGASRDEAGPQQRGHGKVMEASLDQDGDGWKPHLARFMQPLFLIGECAPDRSPRWGCFPGVQGGLLDSIPDLRGSQAKGPALAVVMQFRFLVSGLARGVEACSSALRSWIRTKQNQRPGNAAEQATATSVPGIQGSRTCRNFEKRSQSQWQWCVRTSCVNSERMRFKKATDGGWGLCRGRHVRSRRCRIEIPERSGGEEAGRGTSS